jgi:hypothetical protein
MTNTVRIKRRTGGAAGAPTSLLNGELAYNETDGILYYGFGIASGVIAASIIAIAGPGLDSNFVDKTTTQSIAGAKTFTTSIAVPTVVGSDNSTNAASTAWVRGYAQPLSTALTNIAAVVTPGSLTLTATNTYTTRVLATGSASRITVTNGDGVAGNPTVDLATSGIGAGTYSKITVDTYGRATVGAQIATGDVTTALGFTPENVANKGAANGYAGLDGTGKVPTSQLPTSVTGGMNYQGTWNASTNTPTFVSGTGTKGYFYKVTTAGTTSIDGISQWNIGDSIVFDGTVWDKIDGISSEVISVAGRSGAVVLSNTDISGLGTMSTQNSSAVNITGGTVAASTISGNITGNAANVTGTVAVANGGTGAVTLTGYVKGAGTTPLTAVANIPNTDITGLGTMSTQSSGAVNITGGTIAASTISGNIAGNAANVTGTVAVGNGGTGAVTLTGYIKGTGTTPVTASTTIPNTDISGLGTMSTQNAAAVAITGGTIDGITFDGGSF